MKKYFLLQILFFFVSSLSLSLSAQDKQQDWFEIPNRTKYFVSPSGFGLKKGEGYYQNTYLFYNSVGYGITDHISVNAGILALDLFNGADEFIFTLNPKWTMPIEDNIHIGIAGSFLFYVSPAQFSPSGALYGVGTYGNKNNNVSAGLGVGFDESDLYLNPVIVISGQFRAFKNISFISENWIHPFSESSNLPAWSFGLRLMGKRISFDLAYINLPGINFDNDPRNTRSHLPFITFMASFGKR